MTTQNGSRVITNSAVADKTLLAYVRCSTIEQNEARQLEALKSYDICKTFIEKASAKDTDRPMLQQMLDFAREGDTIYIKDFSRLARSTADLLHMIETLDARGIKLISLNENLDTSTATGKMLVTIIAAINAFERENLLERQREGVLLAKQRGAYKGRKPVEKPADWPEVYELYRTRQITGAEAMRRLELKRTTFYKFVADEQSA